MNEPLSVLIVEDDPHVLLGCQQALELEDIPCIGVGSAEAAQQPVSYTQLRAPDTTIIKC
ncbi:hypothetical protein JR315_16120 [Pseudomonas aeruginosa]|nr:hypothetical protein [Pseudomonas aeruginosa]